MMLAWREHKYREFDSVILKLLMAENDAFHVAALLQ
jgi:hypothetical protein